MMQHSMNKRLAVMTGISFVAMYLLMYAMVDKSENMLPNINTLYMALMMTAAMVMIELVVMGSMYAYKTKMIGLTISAIFLFASVIAIRTQAFVGNEGFLRSMIPHHAAALLMCNEAKPSDPEIQKLCAGIVSSQQAEIYWMKAKLSQP
jgi:uncharacterized protein (DUF305 family)